MQQQKPCSIVVLSYSVVCLSSLLLHHSQLLGAVKPVLLGQSVLAIALLIATQISQTFKDKRLENSELSCNFHLADSDFVSETWPLSRLIFDPNVCLFLLVPDKILSNSNVV